MTSSLPHHPSHLRPSSSSYVSATGRVYVVMESRLGEIPGAIPKVKKGKKGGDEAATKGFEVSQAASVAAQPACWTG